MYDPLPSDLVLVSIAIEEFRDLKPWRNEQRRRQTSIDRVAASVVGFVSVSLFGGDGRKLSEGQTRSMTAIWSALGSCQYNRAPADHQQSISVAR